jgi:hypothetical protein
VEGQWIGSATNGEAPGRIIMDIDDLGDRYRGTARLFIEGDPGVVCEFTTSDKGSDHVFANVPLAWIPVGRAAIIDRAGISSAHPETTFPGTAQVSVHCHGESGVVSWETDLGTRGEGRLVRSRADLPSDLAPLADVDTWGKFKEFALSQGPGQFIFRGQSEAFRLRTAFHRTHRKDLVRYVADDIPLAYRMLMARTRHLFDLSRPEQEGAFWNLLQHHGYPTPLLDWSQSPFVAAFFAYRRRQRPDAPSDKVRILAFNAGEWSRDFNQLQAVNFADLHFSMLTAMAIENPRAIPQQGLSTLTNIDDIEAYIHMRETERGKCYLYAIDLPASLRRDVMVELSLMGITAGSLFPGLDGACEELRGRMFHQ